MAPIPTRLEPPGGAALAGFPTVSGTAAADMARWLARTEAVVAGFSKGANRASANLLLEGPERGGTVGAIACDWGLKYLATGLWP